MSTNKRNPSQRDHDIRTAARMSLEGYTQTSIGDSLGVSQQQVSVDLSKARHEWKESTLVAVDELIKRELEKLQQCEDELWKGWRITLEDGKPNPRHVFGILACVRQRCEILGLNSPLQHEIGALESLGEAFRQALQKTEEQATKMSENAQNGPSNEPGNEV